MCTAIRFNDRFFGRTFDYEHSYGEQLVVSGRGSLSLVESKNRYAIMGVGIIHGGEALYFDGINEWGLCSAALNFPRFAVYTEGGSCISAARLNSLVLGLCRSVSEARDMLSRLSVSGAEGDLPTTPLHWLIADGREAMAVEPLAAGLTLTDDPSGVLTNSPPLSYHLTRLDDFLALSPKNPPAADGVVLYSRGMGAVGLPGGFSSSARFVRAAFLRENCSVAVDGTVGGVGQALDVLSSLALPRGAVLSDSGEPVYTRYTAVMDMASPSYYLTTATCRTVRRLTLTDRLRDSGKITAFRLYHPENIMEIS